MKARRAWSLNGKMVAVLVVLLMLPLAAAGTYLYSSIQDDLELLAEEQLGNYAVSSGDLLKQKGEDLLNVNLSYLFWSDFRNSLLAEDEVWIADNVLTVTDVIGTVHFAVITDVDGKVFSQSGDAPGFTQTLDPLFVELLNGQQEYSGLIPVGDGLALISVAPVTNEDGTQPAAGILIFGRYVDETVVGEIREVIHADIAMLAGGGAYVGAGDHVTRDLLEPYAEELSAGSQQVSATVEGIADISTRTAERSVTLERFTQDQYKVMERISASMEQLKNNANSLEDLVEKMEL